MSAINDMWYQNQSLTFLIRKLSSFAQDICLVITRSVDSFFYMKIFYLFRILVKWVYINLSRYCCFISCYIAVTLASCQQATRISNLLLHCCTRKRKCSRSLVFGLILFIVWINQWCSFFRNSEESWSLIDIRISGFLCCWTRTRITKKNNSGILKHIPRITFADSLNIEVVAAFE